VLASLFNKDLMAANMAQMQSVCGVWGDCLAREVRLNDAKTRSRISTLLSQPCGSLVGRSVGESAGRRCRAPGCRHPERSKNIVHSWPKHSHLIEEIFVSYQYDLFPCA
jgi:hypothetical protein